MKMIEITSKYTPLFYSEISSSFMLYSILNQHKDLLASFVLEQFGISLSNPSIEREHSFPGKGSIDLMISDHENIILIEVKVHDYYSVTVGQIQTYWDAAISDFRKKKIRFLYLTQYNHLNCPSSIAIPSITEYQEAYKKIGNDLVHVNWEQVYFFLMRHKKILSKEELHMVELQWEWMSDYISELNSKKPSPAATRDIFEDYFDDLSMKQVDLKNKISGGKTKYISGRELYVIDLRKSTTKELDEIVDMIRIFTTSTRCVDIAESEKSLTNMAASNFMETLSKSSEDWELLSFYARLFKFATDNTKILLNGTGRKGFSLLMRFKEKGQISLCTIWTERDKHSLEFSMLR